MDLSDQNENLLSPLRKSPASLTADDVVFSYMEQPDEEAAYRSQLPNLYTNESLHM